MTVMNEDILGELLHMISPKILLKNKKINNVSEKKVYLNSSLNKSQVLILKELLITNIKRKNLYYLSLVFS